ncbi:MAG: hypothetical protein KBH45_02510, partial [Verrucomicrobia bacterium]|nr:hypothetical protein [Verrucomicrobiota bacterium]
MTQPTSNASSEAVLQQLNLLTREDLFDMADYATRRLKRVGLTALEGEDIAQDAIQAILVGLEEAKQGRHPRASDVINKATFKDYAGGVINSLVTVERQHPFGVNAVRGFHGPGSRFGGQPAKRPVV